MLIVLGVGTYDEVSLLLLLLLFFIFVVADPPRGRDLVVVDSCCLSCFSCYGLWLLLILFGDRKDTHTHIVFFFFFKIEAMPWETEKIQEG